MADDEGKSGSWPTAAECSDLDGRIPSLNAPLIEVLQGPYDEVRDRLLAIVGDRAAGPGQTTTHRPATSDDPAHREETYAVDTLSGGDAWVTFSGEGRFVRFGYQKDGHDLPYEASALEERLRDLMADLEVEGLAVTSGPGFTHNSFGDSDALEAEAQLWTGPYPVAHYQPERFLDAWTQRVSVRQEWVTFAGSTKFNDTDIRVDAIVQTPDASTITRPDAATPLAALAVRCGLAESRPEFPSKVRAFPKRDALYDVSGSLAWAISVEYGDLCLEDAINGGREWDAWVMVDAATGAILDVTEGWWNCIGIPSPQEAPGIGPP